MVLGLSIALGALVVAVTFREVRNRQCSPVQQHLSRFLCAPIHASRRNRLARALRCNVDVALLVIKFPLTVSRTYFHLQAAR